MPGMSKWGAVTACLILGAIGFGLGHYTASRSAAGTPGSETLPASQSREALRQAIAETDPFVRAIRLGVLLPALSPAAIEDVRERLQDRTFPLGAAEVELLTRFWASHEPKAAAEWALTQSPLDYRTSAIVAAFGAWGRIEPEAAVARLTLGGAGASAGFGHEPAQSAFIRGWYASGLPGLEDYIRSLEMGPIRQRGLSVFARAIIHRDGPEAAMEWAESIPDEPWRYKLAAFRHLGTELAKYDLDAALAWCERQCENEKYGQNLRERLAVHFAYEDGPAAMEWIASAPPGPERDLAVRGAFRGWRRRDQEALLRWIDEEMDVENVPAYFRAASGLYAMAISWDRPQEALKWAELIEPEENRDLALMTIARRWREVDESAAEAWLQQSNLSEELRAKARIFPEGYPARRGSPAAAEAAEQDAEPEAG